MLTNLTSGQAAKFAHLGDAVRRAAWPRDRSSLVGPGYGYYQEQQLSSDDLMAEDWIAEYTPQSV